MIAVGAIAAVAAAAIAFVVIRGGQGSPDRSDAPRTRTVTAAVPPAVTPAAGTSPVDVSAARAVVVRYLDKVNAQDLAGAKALICSRLADSWAASVTQPGGDFTVTVNRATLTTARATTVGDELQYDLTVADRDTGQLSVTTVVFTVVDENGAVRICGEG